MFVIPSNLVRKTHDFSHIAYNNYSLKLGQVIKVNYPDPNIQNSPQIITYNVAATEHKGATQAQVIYYNCTLMDKFGSAADFLEYNLRTNDPSVDITKGATINLSTDAAKFNGAMVLLLCLGGNISNAIIVGCVRSFFANNNENTVDQNTDVYDVPTISNGTYMTFNYNGIYININADGELLLNRGGPTDNDGALITDQTNQQFGIDTPDANAAGSFIQIDKTGKITIAASDTNDITNPDNMITLEKGGDITISNNNNQNTIKMTQDGNINITLGQGNNSFQINGVDAQAQASLGTGAFSAAVAEQLQTYMTNLVQQIGLTISTAQSIPSGGLLLLSLQPATWPQWDSSINSSSLKIPG